MPGGDRTGPEGLGRMTGRKMGLCTGNDTPGYANPQDVPGRGYGRGGGRGFNRGGGRGRGFGFGSGRGFGFRSRAAWNDEGSGQPAFRKDAYEEEVRILKEKVRELEKKLSNGRS